MKRSIIMATVPSTIADKLAFFEQHLPVWAKDPVGIGLTAIQLASLANMVADARAAFDAAQDARAISRAATVSQSNAMSVMGEFGSDLVTTIRAFAETSNDPEVYAVAQIPPPAPPTPAGPPEQPTNLTASLTPGGALKISWKGSVASSAYFSVYRRAAGETAFTLLDSTDTKFYEDTSIPAGVNNVTYYIQARRDEFRVDSGWFQVNFGSGSATVTAISMAA